MKKLTRLFGVGAFVLAGLGGCTATGGNAPLSIQSVQQALTNACGYELLASTAAADIAAVASTLLPASGIAVATASAVASAICAAAKQAHAPSVPHPSAFAPRGAFAVGAPLMVNGVPVHGAYAK